MLARGTDVVAVEVKSGRRKAAAPGMEAFAKRFRVKRQLLVGQGGIPVEDFLSRLPGEWLA